MINSLILVIVSIFVPFFIILGTKIYKVNNINKVYKWLAISILALELIKFFTNASFYDKAITPPQDLKFSYISFLVVFILFSVFNKGKVGKFFKNITIYTSLIPLIFGLCTNRVYMNPLDTYYIIPATYYLESGLIIGLASLFILNLEEVNYKNELINALYSLGIWAIYIGIMIGTKYYWKLDAITYDLSFYLSIFLSILSIPIAYLAIYLINKFYLSKRNTTLEVNKENNIQNV